VLFELKKEQWLTTRGLAARLGASVNSIRHHLKELEEQGLVEFERQHRGVGAPTFAYRLTASGEALFPRRYEATLIGLLEDLMQRDGRPRAVALLEARYSALAERLDRELSGASASERLEAVANLLSQDGYMAEGSIDGTIGTLVAHNCAIHSVAQEFPEICSAEARLLEVILGGTVTREKHILNGCSACEYRVRYQVPAAGATVSPALTPGLFAPSREENA
jgi:DeoR family suf operon transcriptional repressor